MKTDTIPQYLEQLRAALQGSDPAIIQDALYDAEEHLRSALEAAADTNPGTPEVDILPDIIASYGTPEEIAAAYREVEAYTRPTLAASRSVDRRGPFARFFGVFASPQAWGALVYMLISLLTGTLYFCWAIVGVSFSLTFALFIFGLPLAAFFLLSIRGIVLVEGRIVEGLLGVRMPRRTVFSPPDLSWHQRLVSQIKDPGTWKILGYLVLQMPFGVLYFSLVVILIATAIAFIGMPIITSFGLPVAVVNGQTYFAPVAAYPFTFALGVLIATLTLHFARWIGGLHGRFARFMLVGE